MRVLRKSRQHVTAQIEDIHDAVSRERDVVVLRRVLLRVRDEQLAADVDDVERRKAVRQVRVRECARRQGGGLEIRAVDFDGARAEIRRV